MTGETPETKSELNQVERAEAAVKRMEELDHKIEENLKTLTELTTRNILGGNSEAGSAPIPPKVETPKEYKDRILRGG